MFLLIFLVIAAGIFSLIRLYETGKDHSDIGSAWSADIISDLFTYEEFELIL